MLPSQFSHFPLGIIRMTIDKGNVIGIVDSNLPLIDNQVRKMIPNKNKRYVCFNFPLTNCNMTGASFSLNPAGLTVTSYDKYDDAISKTYTNYAKSVPLFTMGTLD